MTAIYLSPHHDDICFSLGWTALSGSGGHLVNLFSRSSYQADGLCSRQRRNRIARFVCRAGAMVERISRIRDCEDRAFAARCNLTRHDLGLPDALLAGKHTRKLDGVESEAALLGRRLIPLLLDLADREGLDGAPLYCPIGIGDHRDHVATLMAVLDALPRLCPRFRLAFYEDLHYASDARMRASGLERLERLCQGVPLRHRVTELDAGQFAEKLRLVALYVSQHRRPPVPARFSPASAGVPGPHEACWVIAA